MKLTKVGDICYFKSGNPHEGKLKNQNNNTKEFESQNNNTKENIKKHYYDCIECLISLNYI